MEAIRIHGLTKTYGAVRALDGLDLSVASGSVFGFLGPNGAGKTTTIRILTGLAHASGGRAVVSGAEVTAHRDAASRRIGHLAEEPATHWATLFVCMGIILAALFGAWLLFERQEL